MLLHHRPNPTGITCHRQTRHPHTPARLGPAGLATTHEPAVEHVAHALGLGIGAPVTVTSGVYQFAHRPVQWVTTYTPPGQTDRGRSVRVTERVQVRDATPREQAELDLGALASVMEIRRVCVDTVGKPVELGLCVLVSGCHAVYEFGA
ncbi:UTRA domain-containing protein [Nocardiopsis rhodophaea]|uniref:UTRA domain-containing protein n=1 Tax=Nocardiopsis rhodophaea TaxID=280238 RepID=UPI0031DE8E3F